MAKAFRSTDSRCCRSSRDLVLASRYISSCVNTFMVRPRYPSFKAVVSELNHQQPRLPLSKFANDASVTSRHSPGKVWVIYGARITEFHRWVELTMTIHKLSPWSGSCVVPTETSWLSGTFNFSSTAAAENHPSDCDTLRCGTPRLRPIFVVLVAMDVCNWQIFVCE